MNRVVGVRDVVGDVVRSFRAGRVSVKYDTVYLSLGTILIAIGKVTVVAFPDSDRGFVSASGGIVAHKAFAAISAKVFSVFE